MKKISLLSLILLGTMSQLAYAGYSLTKNAYYTPLHECLATASFDDMLALPKYSYDKVGELNCLANNPDKDERTQGRCVLLVISIVRNTDDNEIKNEVAYCFGFGYLQKFYGDI